jgi:glucans biosynthesis protein
MVFVEKKMYMLERKNMRLHLAALFVFGVLALQGASAHAFNFNDVSKRAKALADKSYKKPDATLPPTLRNLNHEQYSDIHFRPEKSVWRGQQLPFELTFMHRGGIFNEPVRINEITPNGVAQITFDSTMFDYGKNAVDAGQLKGLGFSGFRIRFPVNSPKVKDDVLSFQGASYFRAMGKSQGYGLSARGLAINTAVASGEEFPRFVEFWLNRPKAGDKTLTIYALLDSQSVTGAYEFQLRPGVDTVIDVRAKLFFRNEVTKLGIAPLTSMFFFGENQQSRTEDVRPEVHDSDGLSILTGEKEWIWRPLVNPKRLLVTSFATTNPLGFGLMQRDRNFSSYLDLDNRYESRPSTWITPKGKWGEGSVELVQIPTPDETNDNIVAYWMPKNVPKAGKTLDFAYSMAWQKNAEKRPASAWVEQTRIGYSSEPGKAKDGITRMNIDFAGDTLKKLGDKPVEGIVTADDNGRLISVNTRPIPATGGWRVEVAMRRNDENKPVELRGHLRNPANGTTLSETWSYILPPN